MKSMATNVIGNAGKPRLFAMIIDNLVATILSAAIAVNLPGLGDMSRALLLVAIYLAYYLVPEALWSRTPILPQFR